MAVTPATLVAFAAGCVALAVVVVWPVRLRSVILTTAHKELQVT